MKVKNVLYDCNTMLPVYVQYMYTSSAVQCAPFDRPTPCPCPQTFSVYRYKPSVAAVLTTPELLLCPLKNPRAAGVAPLEELPLCLFRTEEAMPAATLGACTGMSLVHRLCGDLIRGGVTQFCFCKCVLNSLLDLTASVWQRMKVKGRFLALNAAAMRIRRCRSSCRVRH